MRFIKSSMNKVLIEKNIKRLASKILKKLKKRDLYLEINLISPQKIKALNKKYRGKNKATNILSFPEPRGFLYPNKQKRLGEIYLNSSAASDKENLKILLIHGILHLFGYQHKKKSDRIKMERMEQFLIKTLKPKN